MKKNSKKQQPKQQKQYRVKQPAFKEKRVLPLNHNAPAFIPVAKYNSAIYNERSLTLQPASMSTDSMILPATILDASLQQLYQVTASYLFAFSSVATRTQATGIPPAEAFSGIAYMIDTLVKYARGVEELGKVPHIYAILGNLLRNKEIPFRHGKVQYAPNINDQTYQTIMMLSNGDTWFNSVPQVGGSSTITLSNTTITPDSEAYGNVLSTFGRPTLPLSEIRDITNVARRYKTDASCYARTYPYFGSSGVLGVGLFNDAELEVWFKFPSFSKFVAYNKNDIVVSRVFRPQSGGPAMNIAFALTDQQFHQKHLANQIPTIYKFLDLNELYLIVATWLARVYASRVFTPDSPDVSGTLPFSKNDFMVILRQAVLSQFEASQLHGQFCQPLEQTIGTSLFKPLVMDPATIPSPTYGTMMIPQALKENLCMLRQASYCGKEKIYGNDVISSNRVTYVPVWGFYSDDEIPDIIVPTSDPYPLFQKTDVLPTYKSITDLIVNSSTVKLNPNCQDAFNILSTWNSTVQQANNMGQVAAIAGDVNFTGNLLIYTRIQQVASEQLATAQKIPDPSSKYIKDTIVVPAKTKKDKDNVKVVAVANVYTQNILSAKTIPQEYAGNLQKMLLPSLRLDEASTQDQLSMVAWQTYCGEVCSLPFTTDLNTGGLNLPSRAFQYAGDLITASFAPSNEQDTLAQALQKLGEYSWGASLLGDVFGGLLGMVPGVGPVLGQLVRQL